MALGTNLNAIAARVQFSITSSPLKVVVSRRSDDYVWQSYDKATPAGPGWRLRFGPTTPANRDEAKQHYLDNKGHVFQWTNPNDTVTYDVVYDPDEEPDFDQASVNNCTWEISLLPATV